MALGKIISQLRRRENLSQEQFAELFEVSQQSVQKWETGVTVPNLEKLIRIAKYFDLSLDSLVMSEEGSFSFNRRFKDINFPKITARYSWEIYCGFMKWEYRQSIDEGLDLGDYKAVFDAVSRLPCDEPKRKMADALFETIISANRRPDYKYTEPGSIAEIHALRTPSPEKLPEPGDLRDFVRGAWMGRAIGVLLGRGICGLRGEERKTVLESCGNAPMYRYMLSTDITEELKPQYSIRVRHSLFADCVQKMPYDGSLNYMVFTQMLIDCYGRDFTFEDVSKMWVDHMRKENCHTAERVAYRNFINGYLPPESAVHKNPFREWLGARTRSGYYGYINPACPEVAAEMAWRDAVSSHTKNGVYSAMLLAAMLAAAAVEKNPVRILQYGMAEIPVTSRLYDQLNSVLSDYQNGATHEDFLAYLNDQYDEFNGHDWCFSIPNTMIVVAALLYGEGDFGKSVCLAVESGFESICNGATTGSLLGMMVGESAIDPYWKEPISDTFDIRIFGKTEASLSVCAEKTLQHINEK